MEGLGRVGGAQGRQVYHEVIEKVVNLANGILVAMEDWGRNSSWSKTESDEKLIVIVKALYQLVPVAKQYAFLASIKFAALNGDLQTVTRVIKHPLVKYVVTYLSVVDSDAMFLNWKLEVYTAGWIRKKKFIKVSSEISLENPYAEEKF